MDRSKNIANIPFKITNISKRDVSLTSHIRHLNKTRGELLWGPCPITLRMLKEDLLLSITLPNTPDLTNIPLVNKSKMKHRFAMSGQ